MDLDKAAKSVYQFEEAIATAKERMDFHMTQVRRGTDTGLRDAHLGAAQRHYDAVWRYRACISDIFARAFAE